MFLLAANGKEDENMEADDDNSKMNVDSEGGEAVDGKG